MKGDVTMQVPSGEVIARLSALEEYVDMPTERTAMTVTAGLEAQHSLLLALQANQSETNRRLTELEVGMGKVLHGITTIKNLLRPGDDPVEDSRPNGSLPPP